MKKKESLNALLMAALQASKRVGCDVIPEGWLTMQQWADECGIARRTMLDRVETLTRAGRMECKIFLTDERAGRRSVKHYRLIPQPEHHTAD
jgi:hypothetical protein